MKKNFCFVLLFFSFLSLPFFCEEKIKANSYSIDLTFPIYDGSLDMVTMSQFQTLFSSAQLLAYKAYTKCFPFEMKYGGLEPLKALPPLFLTGFIFVPLVHEEAHRAILTYKGIGSVSQPIFNQHGAAYVKGVSDDTLKNLRDSDFSTFIRLHTAGIENDYTLMQSDFEKMVFFNSKENKIISDSTYCDYLGRFASVFSYMFVLKNVMKPSSQKRLIEEKNELDRDIVGHDVYGMIHHLFNPTGEYHRYWDPCDMSYEELKFGERIGWLNLFNLSLLNPLLLGFGSKTSIRISENHLISFTTGYALAPFGDFIDQRLYYGYYGFKNSVRLSLYIREYGNRNHWFPAFGLKILQFSPTDWFTFSAQGHFWMQPENFDFNTSVGKAGGAFEYETMFYPRKQNGKNGLIGILFGGLIKSAGFLPTIESHDFYWKLTAGVSYRLKA
ncbi:MAG: hypothetical protein HUJ68_02430 [Clostridia bacterium]|nr:hypothetical protein [Clostridia bacterium]